MPRGRLIYPFRCTIAQLDTAATEAYDPAGPATSGYDKVFREPVLEDTDGDGIGQPVREETLIDNLLCQVETKKQDDLAQGFDGDVSDTMLTLVFHFRQLENLGLVVPATGEAKIRKGDRLVSITDCRTGELVQSFEGPPKKYATEVKSSGFGFGRKKNLLIVRFEDREEGRVAL